MKKLWQAYWRLLDNVLGKSATDANKLLLTAVLVAGLPIGVISVAITGWNPEAPPVLNQAPPKQPKKEWFEYLPPEDKTLRQQLAADPWLEGWLMSQKAWVGYASADELNAKGFFINYGLKHTGTGRQPKGEVRGACSLLDLGQKPAAICGRGFGSSPQAWGVQSDEAASRIKRELNLQ